MGRQHLITLWKSVLIGLVVVSLGGPADAGEPFDYFENNWNVLGLKDYQRGARLTPDNRLMLADKHVVQIRFGRELAPLSRKQGKLALEGWMPIILITAHDGSMRYEFTCWATPLPSVKNWKKAFDWPTEGENFLNWITVKVTNAGTEAAEAKLEFRLSKSEDETLSSLTPSWHLGPGEKAEYTARYPFFRMESPKAFGQEDPTVWLERTVAYWRGLLSGRCHIEVPCAKATEALLAAHVCQLIANDRGELHGGEGFYDTFWIRDGAYQVMEVEEAGLMEAARKAMEAYRSHQRPDGRFESQKGQFDANGQAVWVLWQFYKMTGDREWLAEVYPQMRRAVDWTMKTRRETPEDSPFAGVLPNAPADGEYLWGGEYHIVGYDLWNLRGMLCTADAARILGRTREADELTEEAKQYRAAIDAAWKRTGLAHFPPSWEKVGTHWGNTETLWPTELFDRDDPRVSALVRHVREEFNGGYIEGTIQWRGNNVDAIHPYMGAYTTMTDLVLGNHEDVVADFYWYLLHSTAAHAFPEGIYYKRRNAWGEKIPHVTGACNYAIMLRHMLIHEAGDELHLLSAVPDWWLDEGKVIRVERAPTYFGLMDLTVRGTKDGVEVRLTRPTRNAPKRIVLHLPKSRPAVAVPARVEVATRTNQKKRWDFSTVVELYEQTCNWTKPNIVSLTTGKPTTCSHGFLAHPAHRANDGQTNDTDSYWATDVQRRPGDAWWQVDLEKPTLVGRIVVIAYYGDNRYYGFTVETSTDGEEWDMVADRRDNTAPSTEGGYTCRFTPRSVRYIRVSQTSNSANTGRHLVEVMAFEK